MEEPKDKQSENEIITEDNQTNLNLGDKEELSTSSPEGAENETSDSSNKGKGPSGEDL